MKKNPWLLLVFLVVGCFVVASCSDDGGEGADVDDVAGGGDADGSGDGQVSEVGVPLPASADAVSTTESGPLTVVQFIVPLSEQESTISFYDDWTGSQADTYLRTEAESGGVTWLNEPDSGSEQFIISVLSPLEGDDFVTVTVTAGALE